MNFKLGHVLYTYLFAGLPCFCTWMSCECVCIFLSQVWTVSSGFCFVTFSEHTNAVTALHFMANNHCLLSASLDGTVRAWDLFRYRNFRTFTTPSSRQFVSLAADQSGEVICAGTLDSFEVRISFGAVHSRSICCFLLFLLTECLIFVCNRYLFGQWRQAVYWMSLVVMQVLFMGWHFLPQMWVVLISLSTYWLCIPCFVLIPLGFSVCLKWFIYMNLLRLDHPSTFGIQHYLGFL